MLLPTLLFATAAAAAETITTSMWLQGVFEEASTLTFHGSVIGASKDRTTISLDLQKAFTDIGSLDVAGRETVTIGGLTYVELGFSSTVSIPNEKGDATVGMTCSRTATADAKPVCTISTGGNLAYLQYCAGWGDRDPVTYSEVYTEVEDSSTSVRTYVQTLSHDSLDAPIDFCEGSTLPDSIAVQSNTMATSRFATYGLILTAGVEKLSATARVAPTISGLKPTGTGSKASGTAGEAQETGSGAGAASAPANTGLAAPVVTPAAALAAVAMAAFVL